MLLGDLAAAAGIDLPDAARATDIRGITADSRTAGRGFVFAALSGTAADGARFVSDAVGRGAVAVVAARDAVLELPDGVALLRAAVDHPASERDLLLLAQGGDDALCLGPFVTVKPGKAI